MLDARQKVEHLTRLSVKLTSVGPDLEDTRLMPVAAVLHTRPTLSLSIFLGLFVGDVEVISNDPILEGFG